MLYADKLNLAIETSGQVMTFLVDGRPVLKVDLTATDLIEMIRDSYESYARGHGVPVPPKTLNDFVTAYDEYDGDDVGQFVFTWSRHLGVPE